MAGKLIIRFSQRRPGVDPDLVSWVLVDDDGYPGEVYQGSLDETVEFVAGHKVIVLVPGIDVLLTSANIPTQNRKRLATALPFALEEQFISDVEDLHFAVGERNVDGQVSCAVVARNLMDHWMEKLHEFGIQPDLLIPDTLAVPSDEGSWVLLKEDDNVLIRMGPQTGFVTEFDNLKAILQFALDEKDDEHRPARFHILDSESDEVQWNNITELGIDVVKEHFNGDVLAQLVSGLNTQRVVNLLQGDYSRREQLGKIWRPWWPAAAMLAGLVLLKMTVSAVDYFTLSNQTQALQKQIEQTYLSAFPDVRKVVNPRVQMERSLKELRGGQGQDGAGFIGLLAKSGPVFKEINGLELRSVRYKEGKLDIDLTIKDLQTLDDLKQRLTKKAGFNVEIVSANARNDKVESRLQLRGQSS